MLVGTGTRDRLPHPIKFEGDRIRGLWPKQQALVRTCKVKGDSIALLRAASVSVNLDVGIEQAVRLITEYGKHTWSGGRTHMHGRGIDERQVLLYVRAIILGDYDIGALTQPGINLLLRADDHKLDGVSSLARIKEAHPAGVIAVTFRVRRIFP